MSALRSGPARGSVPVTPLAPDGLEPWLERAPRAAARWARATGFRAEPGRHLLVPGTGGRLDRVLCGVAAEPEPFELAALPGVLPAGDYHLDHETAGTARGRRDAWPPAREADAALGWLLAGYRFGRYRGGGDRGPGPTLGLRPGIDREAVEAVASSVALVRDLVNTPAGDLGPAELWESASALAAEHGAEARQVVGAALLEQGYPAIHAVGRASPREPRLLELRWGPPRGPRLTLVGKGVTFDTGGLDLKPSRAMRLMKKDMGGAAHALALARLVMGRSLPVRLRVLVPAVDNAVAGDAYRPGDVVRTRSGRTVEIDNTDAEGRVVLADALTAAGEEHPDLVVDFATLTGAARVALGTDLPALFCNDDATAEGLLDGGRAVGDPAWRLPLHRPYRELLESPVADLANASATPYAGAVLAGLFLESFVPAGIDWAHFDVMAWNVKSRPGRPEGGEAMGLRATWRYLEQRYRRRRPRRP